MRNILSMTAFVLLLTNILFVPSSAEIAEGLLEKPLLNKENIYPGKIVPNQDPQAILDDEGVLWLQGKNARFYAGHDVKRNSNEASAMDLIPLPIDMPVMQFALGEGIGIALDQNGDLWRFADDYQLTNSLGCREVMERHGFGARPLRLKNCLRGGIEVDLAGEMKIRYLYTSDLPRFKKIFTDGGMFFVVDENNHLWVVDLDNYDQGESGLGMLTYSWIENETEIFDFSQWFTIYETQSLDKIRASLEEGEKIVWSGGNLSYTLVRLPDFAPIDKVVFGSQGYGSGTIAIDTKGQAWVWGQVGTQLLSGKKNSFHYGGEQPPDPDLYWPGILGSHLCFHDTADIEGAGDRHHITGKKGRYVMCRPLRVEGLKDIVTVSKTRHALDKNGQWWIWEPPHTLPHHYTIDCREEETCSRTECYLLKLERSVGQFSSPLSTEQDCADVGKQEIN